MESLHTAAASFTNSSVLPSIRSSAKLSSPFSGVRYLNRRNWNGAKHTISKQHLLARRHHILGAHSPEGSDQNLAPENLSFETEKSHLNSFQRALDAFCQFAQPHIIVAKVYSTISVSLLAVENFSDISPSFLVAICQAIAATSLMYIYNTGLNQLADIEIDKVNKPDRPLVTGEYSINTTVIIVLSCAIMSFMVGWMVGSAPLLWSLFAYFALGTIYSVNVPFFRWKGNPVAATLCMLCLQVVWPIGNFLHIQTFVLGRPAHLSKALIAGTTFVSILAISLSQFKDIPDIEGDKRDGIQTFAVRFGAEKVFWICIGLLELAYLVVILVGLTSPNSWRKYALVASHSLLVYTVWSRAKSIDMQNNSATESFYRFMWKLISAEYILIHLLR